MWRETIYLPIHSVKHYDPLDKKVSTWVIIFHYYFQWPCFCVDMDLESDFQEDRWLFKHSPQERKVGHEMACAAVRPTAKDIVRRFYAILP